jgi:pimeloyl-ACP methyl ester carboxylesterase
LKEGDSNVPQRKNLLPAAVVKARKIARRLGVPSSEAARGNITPYPFHLTNFALRKKTMRIVKAVIAALLTMLGVATSEAQPAPAPSAQSPTASSARSAVKPTIVLVHGAFADASGWQAVIPILQQDGYMVVAVQNSLESLAGDVETTKRVIDAQAGPVVVVGHSYGGAVITGAAARSANVKALVYIAAFAPEAGEPIDKFLDKYPSDLGAAVVPDAAGFLYIDPAKFHDVIAGDIPKSQAQVAAVMQRPIAGTIFKQSVPTVAWKAIPSWYMVAQQDRALNPGLERFYAKRMNARTTEIESSHAVFISHPLEVAKLISEAAAAERR